VLVALAALMTVATVLFLGAEHAERMRVGVAAVLACALATTAEDPTAEVAAASPHPRWLRCATRLSIGVALVLPIAVLALTLFDAGATGGGALQMLVVLLSGPAIGFGVWAWADLAQPAYAAMTGVLCWSLAIWMLPAPWGFVGVQPWGPPWDAALIRWGALILLGLAVVLGTWRDPLTRGPQRSLSNTYEPASDGPKQNRLSAVTLSTPSSRDVTTGKT
jgi:hypothetical protein